MIWQAWSEIFFHQPDEQYIPMQLNWGNSFILRAGQPMFQSELIDFEIDRVIDLLNETGELKSYEEYK